MPIQIYDHQQVEILTHAILAKITQSSESAFALALENVLPSNGVLRSDLEVEVSIVDDAKIAQVHVEFMGIEGATDVITFAHQQNDCGDDHCEVGEIVVSAETARANSLEHQHTFEAELMLYIIHGLLHLAGHEDHEAAERAVMEQIQFNILAQVWKD